MGKIDHANSAEVSGRRIAAIDGLRGFCAIYIFSFHSLYAARIGGKTVWEYVQNGDSAVPVFFLVSGFLVASSLDKRSLTDPTWRADFFIRRFFRIVPLWWALILAQCYYVPLPPRIALLNMFFLFGFLNFNPVYEMFGIAWTLFAEEVFYLILPWIFKWTRKIKNLLLASAVFYCVSQIWLSQADFFGVPTQNDFIGRSPLAYIHYFFIGILLCFVYRRYPLRSWLAKFRITAWLSWIDVLAAATFFGPIFRVWIPHDLGSVMALLTAFTPGSLWARIYEMRFFRWTGKNCYFIYITQTFFAQRFMGLKETVLRFYPMSDSEWIWWSFPVLLIATCLLAELSWQVWELPWLKLGALIVSRRQRARSIADAASPRG